MNLFGAFITNAYEEVKADTEFAFLLSRAEMISKKIHIFVNAENRGTRFWVKQLLTPSARVPHVQSTEIWAWFKNLLGKKTDEVELEAKRLLQDQEKKYREEDEEKQNKLRAIPRYETSRSFEDVLQAYAAKRGQDSLERSPWAYLVKKLLFQVPPRSAVSQENAEKKGQFALELVCCNEQGI